jgi:hypothetical protein
MRKFNVAKRTKREERMWRSTKDRKNAIKMKPKRQNYEYSIFPGVRSADQQETDHCATHQPDIFLKNVLQYQKPV